MPPLAPAWPRLRGWAATLALLSAIGCGRVGYDRVAVVDGAPPGPPDAAGEPPPDVAPEAGQPETPPDLAWGPEVRPDAPADVVDAPPDVPAPVDRPPDGPPDMTPDMAQPPPVPPTFASVRSITGNTPGLSFTFNAGNGRDRYLLVGIAVETETREVTEVSFGGRALTRLADVSGACASFLYGLVNPQAGDQTLVVIMDGRTDMVIVASAFTGVRQTTSQGADASGSGTEGPMAVTIASAPGDQVADMFCLDEGSASPVAGAGQTERARQKTSTFEAGMSTEPGAASVTMSWTLNGAAFGWASAALSLKPASAMAVRLERRQMYALYANRPGSGPVVRVPKLSALPPNRL